MKLIVTLERDEDGKILFTEASRGEMFQKRTLKEQNSRFLEPWRIYN